VPRLRMDGAKLHSPQCLRSARRNYLGFSRMHEVEYQNWSPPLRSSSFPSGLRVRLLHAHFTKSAQSWHTFHHLKCRLTCINHGVSRLWTLLKFLIGYQRKHVFDNSVAKEAGCDSRREQKFWLEASWLASWKY
jgi:hypothetical protein